jgi:hypothetical protein
MRISGAVFGLSLVLFCSIVLLSPFCHAATDDQATQIQYFPQFADGEGYRTIWSFTGYGSSATTVTVELFDRNGSPVSLATDLGSGSRYTLAVQGYGSASLSTSGTSNALTTGWAKVTSSQMVGASEVYRYAGPGGSASTAAVFASTPTVSATLFAADAQTTAIALLNTAASATTIGITVRNDAGAVVGTSSLSLPGANQTSLFLNQLPGLGNLPFSNGSAELRGSAPFYLLTLAFQDRNFAIAPVLPGRSGSARDALLSLFGTFVQQTKNLGDRLLPPTEEDKAAFADFLKQPDTGIFRLLPRETYDGYLNYRGGGAYYSFSRLDHAYGSGTDISLEQQYLNVGFAGTDLGFMTRLDVPIEGVTASTPAVQYLSSYIPPVKESGARIEQQRAATGFTVDGFRYKNSMEANAATSYAIRSVCYGVSDLLVVVRLVRLDSDGSAVLVWKLLRSYPVTRLTY